MHMPVLYRSRPKAEDLSIGGQSVSRDDNLVSLINFFAGPVESLARGFNNCELDVKSESREDR